MELSVNNHQDRITLNLEKLEDALQRALPLCLLQPGSHECVLEHLGQVEVSLIDDVTISQVHQQFMDIGGATDVITFRHGEILISMDTAERNAAEHSESLEREVVRYMVHGLLHLNGHEDATEGERKEMFAIQESILKSLPQVQ